MRIPARPEVRYHGLSDRLIERHTERVARK
jgi:hypothetical protein